MANRDGDFARTLRALRASADMSQKELSERSGCSVASIADYENGVSHPSFAGAIRLSDALGVTLDQLAGKAAPMAAWQG